MTTETIEGVKEEINIQLPKFYKVILHNDNTTTMDFVIAVLTGIFFRTFEEAVEITMAIHENGEGIAGAPYTQEVANEKVQEVIEFARANSYPLVASFDEL